MSAPITRPERNSCAEVCQDSLTSRSPTIKKPTGPRTLINGIETALLLVFRVVRKHYSRYFLKKSIRSNAHYLNPVSAELEKAHVDFWRPLGKTNANWLRYYVNVSAIEDHRYVPGDIYFPIIEHRLNDADQNDLYNNKNNLDRLYGSDVTPETVLRCMSGVLAGPDYSIVSRNEVSLPHEDLIIKKAFDSHSGNGVSRLSFRNGEHYLPDNLPLSIIDLNERFGPHFIVQKLVRQHPFFEKFNPGSINSLRVYVYRSTADNSIHILRTVMRVGVGNTLVDNLSGGGLSCVVDGKGLLGDYALSLSGDRFETHPETGEAFAGNYIPHFGNVESLARHVCQRSHSHHTLGLDIVVDNRGRAVLIEVNPMSVGLDLMQVDGGPLFGEFSEEVRDFCAANPARERKKIIRP